ncbi:MAG: GNAT family N-acetyltransferase [Alphaproteobacteria bacterium]|nr:GNAT family N-acetyltransferase [Alphaproteobacteria bacterium]
MDIRQAQIADLAQLAKVYVECFATAEERWTELAAFGLLEHFMAGFGREICSVAVMNGAPIGGFFAKLRPWWDGLRITEIEFFVAPKYQNGIVGMSLAAVALERAKTLGATAIEGLVFADEAPLLSMYARAGVEQNQSLTVVSGQIDDVLLKLQSKRLRGFLMNYNMSGKIITGIGADSFYSLMHNLVAEVRAGGVIWAVSGMMESEWLDTEEENAFFADNMAAAERGAKIVRIFIYEEADLPRFASNEKLRTLIADGRIETLFVRRAAVREKMPVVLAALGWGLLGIGDNFLMVDMPDNGISRGYATFDKLEIKKFSDMFEELKNISEGAPR